MKTFTTKSEALGKFLHRTAIFTFWLAVWQIIYILVGQEILVVSPISVFFRIISLASELNFWKIILYSMLRIIGGFFLAIMSGIALAYLCAKFKAFFSFVSPLLIIIKTTPVASFTVLALVFIRSFYIPMFISFLMVLPIVWSNTLEGIKNIDKKLIELAYVFRFTKLTLLNKIYIPSVFPYIYSAISTGLGFAWKSGVAAEVIANTKISIGAKIYDSKIYLDNLDLFSWTVVVIILSVLLERFVIKLIGSITVKYNF